jgi:purine-binding chemotaxis protein CheW
VISSDLKTAVPAARPAAAPRKRQYLTFVLGAASYAVDVMNVQEIRGFVEVTPIPHAPPFVRGLMNLRGTVVPVVDLRMRFQLVRPSEDKTALVVVVNVSSRQVGMLVDGVSAVMTIDEGSISPPPDVATASDGAVTGVALVNDRLVLVLDLASAVGLGTEAALVQESNRA